MLFSRRSTQFSKIGAVNKDIKRKRKFVNNDGYNILRLHDAILIFRFTKNEAKRDY